MGVTNCQKFSPKNVPMQSKGHIYVKGHWFTWNNTTLKFLILQKIGRCVK